MATLDRSELRIGDAERERVAAVVSDAAAEGYLDVTEVDERLDAVWSARTSGELVRVTADLPREVSIRGDVAERSPVLARPLARAWLPYLAGMLLMVGIWLIMGLRSGSWYPWIIWPALGWGMAVAMRTRRQPAGHRSWA